MSSTQLNLKKINLDDAANRYFSILYSNYMLNLYSNYMLKEDFEVIRKPLEILAYRGNLNALTFICFYQSWKDNKEVIERKARLIASKDVKTPEEWLLNGVLHSFDRFEIDGERLTMEDVVNKIRASMGNLSKVPTREKVERVYQKFQPFFESPYYHAIQMAREGFWQRAKLYTNRKDEGFRFMDYCKYVELSAFPYNYRQNGENVPVLDQVTAGVNTLKEEYKKNYENTEKLTLERYCYGKMLLSLESELENEKGLKILKDYSNIPVTLEPTTEEKILNIGK